jgi:single-strand DNA-binding protein
MVNKVILIGNLGKAPEVRRLENGNTVAKFSMQQTKVGATSPANGRRKPNGTILSFGVSWQRKPKR